MDYSIKSYELNNDRIKTVANKGYNPLRLKFLSEFHSNLLSFSYSGKNPADFSATNHSQTRCATLKKN